jgi:hypothetical protein
MKPHPRIRKTIKWGGAAVTVFFVVVWIATVRWRAYWQFVPSQGVALIARGRIEVEWYYTPGWAIPATGIETLQPSLRTTWWFSRISAPNVWGAAAPLWFPACIALLVSGAAWRLESVARRGSRLNLCPKCHYDRAGIAADAKCPECGAPSV